MFEAEKNRLLQQAGESGFLKAMAMQTIELMNRNRRAGLIMADDKSLQELKKTFDKCAAENRKGNESFVTPEDAEKMICEYYDLSPAKPNGKLNVLDLI